MKALTITKAEEMRIRNLGFLKINGTDEFSGRIITINGRVNSEQLRRIADAAEKYGNGEVIMTTRLTFECTGIPYENIEPFRKYIEECGMEMGGLGKKLKPVVSCKGSKCKYGLIDTYDISEEIHNEIYRKYSMTEMPQKFKIAVGGCPNNCVKADLNDLGIVGRYIPELDENKCRSCKKCGAKDVCPSNAVYFDDNKAQIDYNKCINCGRCEKKCLFKAIKAKKTGYKVYVGGRRGKRTTHGKMLKEVFTTREEIIKIVEKAVLLFRENGIYGERFVSTIERTGFEKIEKELVSDKILLRKEEILEKEIKK